MTRLSTHPHDTDSLQQRKRLYVDVLKDLRPEEDGANIAKRDKRPRSDPPIISAAAAAAAAAPSTFAASSSIEVPPAVAVLPAPHQDASWRVLRFVGKGAFGQVNLVQSTQSTSTMQLVRKRINEWDINRITAQQTVTEYQVASFLRHPNLLPMLRFEKSRMNVDLFFPFLDTDLSRLLRSPQTLMMVHVKYLMAQLLLGLEHMHQAGVAHRDIKPQNLLITGECNLRIADFGLSRYVGTKDPDTPRSCRPESPGVPCSPNGALTGRVCTRWYRAPELILQRGYNCKVDLFAAGCVMGEMLQMVNECGPLAQSHRRLSVMPLFPGGTCFPISWEPPVRCTNADIMRCCTSSNDQLNTILRRTGKPSQEQIKAIEVENVRSYLQTLPASTGIGYGDLFNLSHDQEAAQLFHGLLQFDPAQRLSATDALNLPFFESQRDFIVRSRTEATSSPRTACSGPGCRCFVCLDSRSLSTGGCRDVLQAVHAEFANTPHP